MPGEVRVPVRLEVIQSSINTVKAAMDSLKPNSSGWRELQKILQSMQKEANNLQITMSKPFSTQSQFTQAEKGINKLENALDQARLTMSRIDFSDLKLDTNQQAVFDGFKRQLQDIQNEAKTFKASLKQSLQMSDAWEGIQKLDPNTATHSFDEIVKAVQSKVKSLHKSMQDAQKAFDNFQPKVQSAKIAERFAANKDVSLRSAMGEDFSKYFSNLKDGAFRFKPGQQNAFYEFIQQNLNLDSSQIEQLKHTATSQLEQAFKDIDMSKILSQARGTISEDQNKQANLNNANVAYKEAQRTSMILGQSLDQLKTEEEELSQKTNQVNSGLQQFQANTTAAARSNTNFSNGVTQANQGLEGMRNQLKQSNAEMMRYQRTMSSINSLKMTVTNFMGFTQVLNIVKKSVREAIQHIHELDDVMNGISVVTNMSTGDLWDQIDAYSNMASKYGVSIKGAYEVSRIYYQQGLETADVMTLTNETLKLAKISGLDYATTTDYMTTALRGFKMEMSDAGRVVDVYSNLAAHTAVSSEELAVAMSKTASSMESVGSTFEESSAMIATMVAVTRESATNIGSALKSIAARYGEMKKDPGALKDLEGEALSYNKVDAALQSVGISLKDSQGEFRNMTDVILELSEVWDQLDSTQQRYIATQFAGNRQQSRFLALVSNKDLLKSNLNYAQESEGTGDTQAEKTLDSISSKLEQAKVAYQEFYTSIGLEDLFKGALDGVKEYINYLNRLPKAFGDIPIAAIGMVMNLINAFKLIGQGLLSGLGKIFDKIIPVEKISSDFSTAMREGAETGAHMAGEVLRQEMSHAAQDASQTMTQQSMQQDQTAEQPMLKNKEDVQGYLQYAGAHDILTEKVNAIQFSNANDPSAEIQAKFEAIFSEVAANNERLKVAFAMAGDDAVAGYVNSLIAGMGQISNAGAQIGNVSVEGLRNAIGAHSPATETMITGQDYVDGYVQGINAKISEAAQTGGKVGRDTLASLEESLKINPTSFDSLKSGIVKELEKIPDEIIKSQGYTREALTSKLSSTTYDQYKAGDADSIFYKIAQNRMEQGQQRLDFGSGLITRIDAVKNKINEDGGQEYKDQLAWLQSLTFDNFKALDYQGLTKPQQNWYEQLTKSIPQSKVGELKYDYLVNGILPKNADRKIFSEQDITRANLSFGLERAHTNAFRRGAAEDAAAQAQASQRQATEQAAKDEEVRAQQERIRQEQIAKTGYDPTISQRENLTRVGYHADAVSALDPNILSLASFNVSHYRQFLQQGNKALGEQEALDQIAFMVKNNPQFAQGLVTGEVRKNGILPTEEAIKTARELEETRRADAAAATEERVKELTERNRYSIPARKITPDAATESLVRGEGEALDELERERENTEQPKNGFFGRMRERYRVWRDNRNEREYQRRFSNTTSDLSTELTPEEQEKALQESLQQANAAKRNEMVKAQSNLTNLVGTNEYAAEKQAWDAKEKELDAQIQQAQQKLDQFYAQHPELVKNPQETSAPESVSQPTTGGQVEITTTPNDESVQETGQRISEEVQNVVDSNTTEVQTTPVDENGEPVSSEQPNTVPTEPPKATQVVQPEQQSQISGNEIVNAQASAMSLQEQIRLLENYQNPLADFQQNPSSEAAQKEVERLKGQLVELNLGIDLNSFKAVEEKIQELKAKAQEEVQVPVTPKAEPTASQKAREQFGMVGLTPEAFKAQSNRMKEAAQKYANAQAVERGETPGAKISRRFNITETSVLRRQERYANISKGAKVDATYAAEQAGINTKGMDVGNIQQVNAALEQREAILQRIAALEKAEEQQQTTQAQLDAANKYNQLLEEKNNGGDVDEEELKRTLSETGTNTELGQSIGQEAMAELQQQATEASNAVTSCNNALQEQVNAQQQGANAARQNAAAQREAQRAAAQEAMQNRRKTGGVLRGLSSVMSMATMFVDKESTAGQAITGGMTAASGMMNIAGGFMTGGMPGALMALATSAPMIISGFSQLFNPKKETEVERLEKVREDLDTYAKNSKQEAQKAKSEYKDLKNLQDRISELSIDRFSSKAAQEEYQSAVNTLAESFPELVSGFDAMGNAIYNAAAASIALTESQQIAAEKQYQATTDNLALSQNSLQLTVAKLMEKITGEQIEESDSFNDILEVLSDENKLNNYFKYNVDTIEQLRYNATGADLIKYDSDKNVIAGQNLVKLFELMKSLQDTNDIESIMKTYQQIAQIKSELTETELDFLNNNYQVNDKNFNELTNERVALFGSYQTANSQYKKDLYQSTLDFLEARGKNQGKDFLDVEEGSALEGIYAKYLADQIYRKNIGSNYDRSKAGKEYTWTEAVEPQLYEELNSNTGLFIENFYDNLSTENKKRLEKLLTESDAYSLTDIEAEFGEIDGWNNIKPILSTTYNEIQDSIQANISKLLSIVSQQAYDGFSALAKSSNIDTILEQQILTKFVQEYENLIENGFVDSADNYLKAVQELYKALDETGDNAISKDSQIKLLNLINKYGVNSQESLMQILTAVEQDEELAPIQNEIENLLKASRNNIALGLQSSISNLTENWSSTMDNLQKAINGVGMEELQSIIDQASVLGMDISLDNFTLQDDKYVLKEEDYLDLTKKTAEVYQRTSDSYKSGLEKISNVLDLAQNNEGSLQAAIDNGYDLAEVFSSVGLKFSDYSDDADAIKALQEAYGSAYTNYLYYQQMVTQLEADATRSLLKAGRFNAILNDRFTSNEDKFDRLFKLASKQFEFSEAELKDSNVKTVVEGIQKSYNQFVSDILSKGIKNIDWSDYEYITKDLTYSQLGLSDTSSYEEIVRAIGKATGGTVQDVNKAIVEAIQKDNERVAEGIVADLNFISDDTFVANLEQLQGLADTFGMPIQTLLQYYDRAKDEAVLSLNQLETLIRDNTEFSDYDISSIKNLHDTIQESLDSMLQTLTKDIKNGINGSLDAKGLKSIQEFLGQHGLSEELGYRRTKDGYKLTAQSAERLYNVLKQIDVISAQIVLDELNKSIEDSLADASKLEGTLKEIATIRATTESDQFKFMENKIPSGQNNPINYLSNLQKMYQTIQAATKNKNQMDYTDFYNTMTALGDLAASAGQPIQLGAEKFVSDAQSAADLIEQGAAALTVAADGSIVVDLSKIGIDFAASADSMNAGVEAGLKTVAESQIDMLDGMIKLLETIVAMEELGNIDLGENGVFDISDIFANITDGIIDNDEFTGKWETARQKLIEDTKTNDEMRAALEQFTVNGVSLYNLLNVKTGKLSEYLKDSKISLEDYGNLMTSLVNMAMSGDYDLDNLYSSIEEMLGDTNFSGEIDLGNGTVVKFTNGISYQVVNKDGDEKYIYNGHEFAKEEYAIAAAKVGYLSSLENVTASYNDDGTISYMTVGGEIKISYKSNITTGEHPFTAELNGKTVAWGDTRQALDDAIRAYAAVNNVNLNPNGAEGTSVNKQTEYDYGITVDGEIEVKYHYNVVTGEVEVEYNKDQVQELIKQQEESAEAAKEAGAEYTFKYRTQEEFKSRLLGSGGGNKTSGSGSSNEEPPKDIEQNIKVGENEPPDTLNANVEMAKVTPTKQDNEVGNDKVTEAMTSNSDSSNNPTASQNLGVDKDGTKDVMTENSNAENNPAAETNIKVNEDGSKKTMEEHSDPNNNPIGQIFVQAVDQITTAIDSIKKANESKIINIPVVIGDIQDNSNVQGKQTGNQTENQNSIVQHNQSEREKAIEAARDNNKSVLHEDIELIEKEINTKKEYNDQLERETAIQKSINNNKIHDSRSEREKAAQEEKIKNNKNDSIKDSELVAQDDAEKSEFFKVKGLLFELEKVWDGLNQLTEPGTKEEEILRTRANEIGNELSQIIDVEAAGIFYSQEPLTTEELVQKAHEISQGFNLSNYYALRLKQEETNSESKESEVDVSINTEQGEKQLEEFTDEVEEERTVPVDADTSKAEADLKALIAAPLHVELAMQANTSNNVQNAKWMVPQTKAKGNVALASGTLMGELGPELVVSNGHYFVAGQNGAEFVDLDPDAIVFNHLQTESLFKNGMSKTRGKAVTNERVATSFAKGNVNGGPAQASASQALSALKQLRNQWKALMNLDPSQMAGAGGGGGGGGDPKAFLKDLEKWYNWLQQIAQLEKEITYEETKRSKIQSDMIAHGQDYHKSQMKTLKALQQQLVVHQSLTDSQYEYFEKRRKELNEQSAFSALYGFGESGQLYYKEGALSWLSDLSGRNVTTGEANYTAEEQYKRLVDAGFEFAMKYDSSGNEIKQEGEDWYSTALQAFWDKIDSDKEEMQSLHDSVEEHRNAVLESQASINEIIRDIEDNQINVEQKVLKAIEDSRQREIDEFQKERDAIEKSSKALIDGLSEQLNLEKEMYSNQQEADEFGKLQRQLAILQRSGGSASQITDLQRQISEKQQNMYFDAQQQQIDALQKASDNQLERLDHQIELMTEQLEYEKENGLLWNAVYEVLQGSPESISEFIKENTKEYWGQSPTELTKTIREDLFEIQRFKEFQETMDGGLDILTTLYGDEVAKKKAEKEKKAAEEKAKAEGNFAASTAGGNGGGNSSGTNNKDQSNTQQKKANHGYEVVIDGKKYTNNGYSTQLEAANAMQAIISSFKITPTKVKVYHTGGLVDETGPAILQKHEGVLTASQVSTLRNDILSNKPTSLLSLLTDFRDAYNNISNATNSVIGPSDGGIIIENATVEMNVSQIANDYDAQRAGEQALDRMVQIARKSQGWNRIGG